MNAPVVPEMLPDTSPVRGPESASAVSVPVTVAPEVVAATLVALLESNRVVESTTAQVLSPLKKVVASAVPEPRRAAPTVPEARLDAFSPVKPPPGPLNAVA